MRVSSTLVELENAIWNVRVELKDRQRKLSERIDRAVLGSHSWHQLQGQAMEVDNLLVRLASLT